MKSRDSSGFRGMEVAQAFGTLKLGRQRTAVCRFCQAQTALIGNMPGLCLSRRRHERQCSWAELSLGLQAAFRHLEECHCEVMRLRLRRRTLTVLHVGIADEVRGHGTANLRASALAARESRAGSGNSSEEPEDVSRHVRDLEIEEELQEEQAIFLEDTLGFLTDQADLMLQSELVAPDGDEDARNNAKRGHASLSASISGYDASLQEGLRQLRSKEPTPTMLSGSTAAPSSANIAGDENADSPFTSQALALGDSAALALPGGEISGHPLAMGALPPGAFAELQAQGALKVQAMMEQQAVANGDRVEYQGRMVFQWQGIWTAGATAEAEQVQYQRMRSCS